MNDLVNRAFAAAARGFEQEDRFGEKIPHQGDQRFQTYESGVCVDGYDMRCAILGTRDGEPFYLNHLGGFGCCPDDHAPDVALWLADEPRSSWVEPDETPETPEYAPDHPCLEEAPVAPAEPAISETLPDVDDLSDAPNFHLED